MLPLAATRVALCIARDGHMDVFMRDSDAFSWYMERDPTLRSTVVAVAWLDQIPDWEMLGVKLEQATRLLPPLPQAGDRAAGAPCHTSMDGRRRVRHDLAPPPHRRAGASHAADRCRVRSPRGHERVRPLAAVVEVHACRGHRRWSSGSGNEAPPFAHRRAGGNTTSPPALRHRTPGGWMHDAGGASDPGTARDARARP